MVLYHCSFVISNSYNEWNIFSFFKYKSFTSSKLLYGLKFWMLIVIAYIPLMLKKRQLSIIILQNSYLVSFKRKKKKIQKNTHDDPLLKILNLHGTFLLIEPILGNHQYILLVNIWKTSSERQNYLFPGVPFQ